MNLYLCIEWVPRHQFSNWAQQFIAPVLSVRNVAIGL